VTPYNLVMTGMSEDLAFEIIGIDVNLDDGGKKFLWNVFHFPEDNNVRCLYCVCVWPMLLTSLHNFP
jgi:hypothetical protein